MTTGLVETVEVDTYGNVTVLFDYEDGKTYVNEVRRCAPEDNTIIATWKDIDGDLLRDILFCLEGRRLEYEEEQEDYIRESREGR